MASNRYTDKIKLTSRDIAEYCQVSKSTVIAWMRSGELIAYKLPSGHNRIDVKDFKKFLTKWKMPVKGWPFETV